MHQNRSLCPIGSAANGLISKFTCGIWLHHREKNVHVINWAHSSARISLMSMHA